MHRPDHIGQKQKETSGLWILKPQQKFQVNKYYKIWTNVQQYIERSATSQKFKFLKLLVKLAHPETIQLKKPIAEKNHRYSVDNQRGISNFMLLLFPKNPSKIGLDRNVKRFRSSLEGFIWSHQSIHTPTNLHWQAQFNLTSANFQLDFLSGYTNLFHSFSINSAWSIVNGKIASPLLVNSINFLKWIS